MNDVIAVKVAANSNAGALAGAYAQIIEKHGWAEMQAVGAGAIKQTLKFVTIARRFAAPTRVRPGLHLHFCRGADRRGDANFNLAVCGATEITPVSSVSIRALTGRWFRVETLNDYMIYYEKGDLHIGDMAMVAVLVCA